MQSTGGAGAHSQCVATAGELLVLKSAAELKGHRHVAIARLLLDHGAKIDNVDVDGDTPISLAEQRGHADLVIMLEEEASIRDLRAKEAAQ